MTKREVRLVLETKVDDMSRVIKNIRTAVYMGDRSIIDATVVRLERELQAFKVLVNGVELGQKEETK